MQGCCLPCLAWLRAGRLTLGGEMLSPSCSVEEVESPGCFWEKSSVMWGDCFLQVGFDPSFLSFFAWFYLQNTLWQSHLLFPISAQGPSSWLQWKNHSLPFSILLLAARGASHPVKGRWMGLRSKALAAVRALKGLVLGFPGVPCPAFRSLGSPTDSGSPEGVVQTRRCGV